MKNQVFQGFRGLQIDKFKFAQLFMDCFAPGNSSVVLKNIKNIEELKKVEYKIFGKLKDIS